MNRPSFRRVSQAAFVASFACLSLTLASAGCRGTGAPTDFESVTVLRLATTTSTRDSGLLDELLPAFETQHNCRVDVIAVGTGAALKLGEAGDADVLVVHARKAELDFVRAGHGTLREEFMYNHFVILGPKDDPSGIRELAAAEAFEKIAKTKARFLSRGDNSGTHKKELAIWETLGGREAWTDYVETGQGMGATLTVADEKQGYVLADSGTYLKFQDKIELIPLVGEDASLRNPYGAILVKHQQERANRRLAEGFVDHLLTSETQNRIREYRIRGRQLFFPTRIGLSHDSPPTANDPKAPSTAP